jgi:hypothetical protein
MSAQTELWSATDDRVRWPYVAGNIAFFHLGQHGAPRQHLDRATDLAAELGEVELLIRLHSRQAHRALYEQAATDAMQLAVAGRRDAAEAPNSPAVGELRSPRPRPPPTLASTCEHFGHLNRPTRAPPPLQGHGLPAWTWPATCTTAGSSSHAAATWTRLNRPSLHRLRPGRRGAADGLCGWPTSPRSRLPAACSISPPGLRQRRWRSACRPAVWSSAAACYALGPGSSHTRVPARAGARRAAPRGRLGRVAHHRQDRVAGRTPVFSQQRSVLVEDGCVVSATVAVRPHR